MIKPRNIYERKAQKYKTKGKSKTLQSAKKECDVNAILNQFSKTGVINHVNDVKAVYGDVSDLGSYQESLQVVMQAEQEFLDLPAKIRKEFDNDPSQMIEFLRNPANSEKAIELGLAERPKIEAPQEPKKEAPKEASTSEEQ